MKNHAISAALCALTLLLAGCSAMPGETKTDDKDIDTVALGELVAWHREDRTSPGVLILIDPRSPERFAEAHIPGAVNLGFDHFDGRFGRDDTINSHDHIVIYGQHPGSAVARAMTKRLLVLGYKSKKVRWFSGGLNAWRGSGLPVEP